EYVRCFQRRPTIPDPQTRRNRYRCACQSLNQCRAQLDRRNEQELGGPHATSCKPFRGQLRNTTRSILLVITAATGFRKFLPGGCQFLFFAQGTPETQRILGSLYSAETGSGCVVDYT